METTRPPLLPVIDLARCTGCGWCVAACHWHLLSLEVRGWKKSAVLHDSDRCPGCRQCALKCPFGAIAMREVPTPVGVPVDAARG